MGGDSLMFQFLLTCAHMQSSTLLMPLFWKIFFLILSWGRERKRKEWSETGKVSGKEKGREEGKEGERDRNKGRSRSSITSSELSQVKTWRLDLLSLHAGGRDPNAWVVIFCHPGCELAGNRITRIVAGTWTGGVNKAATPNFHPSDTVFTDIKYILSKVHYWDIALSKCICSWLLCGSVGRESGV